MHDAHSYPLPDDMEFKLCDGKFLRSLTSWYLVTKYILIQPPVIILILMVKKHQNGSLECA